MDFRHKILRTDVTSLLVVHNHVIAGTGNLMHVISIASTNLVARLKVFDSERIHGIYKDLDKYITVHGVRNVAVISYDFSRKNILTLEAHWQMQDWVQYIRQLDNQHIAIATGQNAISLWNWRRREKVKVAWCEEKCLLYCSYIVGSTWDQLVLFSGTIFREVILWSPADGDSGQNLLCQCPVMHRLQGHKGVIFSIHYSAVAGVVSTTSDDRSVRLWRVDSSPPPSSVSTWRHARIQLLHTLYGHNARVWKSISLGGVIVSIGEDGHLCVWGISEGNLLRRWRAHQGGSVWSIASCKASESVVTGGADGAVSMWSISTCLKNTPPAPSASIISYSEQAACQPSAPRRVVITHGGRVVVALFSGHVLQSDDGRRGADALLWKTVYYNAKLASYCLLSTSSCGKFVSLATLDGHIIVLKESAESGYLEEEIDIAGVSGKIFSLLWLSSCKLLTCGPEGKLEQWCLETLQGKSFLRKIKSFILPYAKERWFTAAVLFQDYLVCGDRNGSVYLFPNAGELLEQIKPCQKFHRLHGRLGVSSLKLLGDYLYSTGRDGTYRQYCLTSAGELIVLYEARLPFDWAASVFALGSDVLVKGFAEKNFVVWSQEQQRVLLDIPCGGGHRSWDCLLDEKSLWFIYIRDRSLYIMSLDLKFHTKPGLQTGFHPREVNALHVLNKAGCSCPLLVSAGEDTSVRVTVACSQEELHTLLVLQSHISSVRALALYERTDSSLLLFSAGSRAQIKAWSLTPAPAAVEDEGNGFCEPSDPCGPCEPCRTRRVCCRELSSHMLMDSDRRLQPWRQARPTVDPEMRYMSLCVLSNSGQLFVCAGCSDGFLRVFRFDEDQCSFLLVVSNGFHQCCILKVAHPSQCLLLTMATDGVLAVWDAKSLMSKAVPVPLLSCQRHQSGINCCASVQLDLEQLLVATGGDDAMLSLMFLRVIYGAEGVREVEQLMWYSKEAAHSAQITGLAFVDKYLITSSVDRHVCVWDWTCDVQQGVLDAKKLAVCFTAIPDVHGLEAWMTGVTVSICLYGKGVEVISWNTMKRKDGEFV